MTHIDELQLCMKWEWEDPPTVSSNTASFSSTGEIMPMPYSENELIGLTNIILSKEKESNKMNMDISPRQWETFISNTHGLEDFSSLSEAVDAIKREGGYGIGAKTFGCSKNAKSKFEKIREINARSAEFDNQSPEEWAKRSYTIYSEWVSDAFKKYGLKTYHIHVLIRDPHMRQLYINDYPVMFYDVYSDDSKFRITSVKKRAVEFEVGSITYKWCQNKHTLYRKFIINRGDDRRYNIDHVNNVTTQNIIEDEPKVL